MLNASRMATLKQAKFVHRELRFLFFHRKKITEHVLDSHRRALANLTVGT